jgi:O-antigen ligase
VVATIFRRRMVEAILAALALQVLVHSGVAGLQVATGRAIGAGLFGGREQVLNEGLDSGVTLLRPSGLFVHPIVFADFLFLSLPLVTAGLALARTRAMRAFMSLTLLAGLAGLALTLSRGAWLSGILVAVVLLTVTRRLGLLSRLALRRTLLAALLVALVGAAAFGPRIYDRLTESHAGNLDVRFELNWIALRMIAAHPLSGQGLNVFTAVMERFDPKDVMAYFPAPAHNLYLLEAAEAGIPALLLLLGMFASILVYAARRIRRLDDPALEWTAIAVVAGLVGLLLSQLADFSYRLEPLRSFVWALIGLLFGALRQTKRSASPRAPGGAS